MTKDIIRWYIILFLELLHKFPENGNLLAAGDLVNEVARKDNPDRAFVHFRKVLALLEA